MMPGRKAGRPRQQKNFQASELEFYRKELTAASSKQDLLGTAQVLHNIQELTGWPIRKMVAEFNISQGTIAKYLNITLLPEPILNCWAARRMSSPVALAFLKVSKELREPLFHEMETTELSFHRIEKLQPLFDRAIASYEQPRPIAPLREPAPPPFYEPVQPEPEPPSPAIVEFLPHNRTPGAWKFGGLISDAGRRIATALDMSSNEIESELSSPADITRLRSALRQLIEQAEIGLSLLDHIAESHKIRRSMITYNPPVAAAHT